MLVLQNMLTVLCSAVILLYLLYKDELLPQFPWMEYVTYTLIILLSTGAHLASQANTIAVERDWIVEICHRDQDRLAAMTATMKAIDLSTQILAPIASGQVMTYAGSEVGAVFIGGWNLLSCGVEYYLLHQVFHTVPALRKKKDQKRIDEDADGQGRKEKESGCKLFSGLTIILHGWRTYMSYKVWLSGLALACLYMTVLGFDTVTIGYAKLQGISESVVGAFQGVGGAFGILATLIYPRMRKCLGLAKSAMLALCTLVMSLTPCLVSVWLPGSPFDLFGLQVTSLDNCTQADTTSGSADTRDYNSSTLLPLDTVTSLSECMTSQVSVYVMLVGIVVARTSLWLTDLSITQQFLEAVLETERGVVNGVQASLNQMMDMVKYALVTALPFANQFGLLVILSYLSICTGAVMQAVFLCRGRRKVGYHKI